MSLREATMQQREPLDATALTRYFAVGGAVTTTLTAVVMAAVERDQVAAWPVEALAVAALAASGALLVQRSSPFRASFGRRSHALVLGLVLVAFLLDELAQLGSNQIVHDDWGLVAIAMTVIVLATLRPWREVLAGGLVASAVVFVAAVLASPFVTVQANPIARALVATSSVLPPALGAAVFGRVVLAARREPTTGEPTTGPPTASVRISVQQERIAELEAEIVPLLQAVVAADALTSTDGAAARRLATGLRATLVAELSRDWLTELGFSVADREGYAERMTSEQRTAIRAVLAALPLARRERPGTAALSGQDFDATIRLVIDVDQAPDRGLLGPVLMHLRSVCSDVDSRTEERRITITAGFRADRH